uniref:Uncharacterized protein n=1 Tax=Oryza rufipogon TaxID=4529 RepID=A0A0E0Q338_ORYRU
MVVSNWATNNGGRVAEGSKRKLSLMFHWANSDYAFGYGNPTEGAVEVPLLPQQEALGENLVQFFGWTTRLLSTSQPSPGGNRSRIETAGLVLGCSLYST